MLHLPDLCTGEIEASNIHPLDIPQVFDCALCPGRGGFERCLGRVGNLNRIYLLFWRNIPVSFARFDGFTRWNFACVSE